MDAPATSNPKFHPGEIGFTLADLPPLPDAPGGAGAPAPGFDPRAWFPDPAAPFELEIGSGKGTFLVQQATLQPETNFLGIEWTREFWLYAADRLRRRGLKNVRLLHADATEFLRYRTPAECVRVLHLYFPDPWPKTRHHKRRTIRDSFLEDAWRVLIPGGELRVVTDHEGYWAWMEEHFARWASEPGNQRSRDRKIAEGEQAPPSPPQPLFVRLPFERPASAGEGEMVGTNFERKYRREGRPFHAAILRKSPLC